MADFSFLSDTDDSAVEDLISQTQELCVLEQVAAINCSGFTDSDLPSELETRFRKLKSFPAAKPKPKKLSSPSPPPSSSDLKPHFDSKEEQKKSAESVRESDVESESFSPSKQNPLGKTPSKPRKRPESASSPSGPSDFSAGNAKFSPLKKTPNGKKVREQKQRPKSKSRSLSSSSSSESSNLWMDSPSPPRPTGCLWWSPKKSSSKKKSNKKKGHDRKVGGADLDWGSDEDFLSDLGVFSAKERQKIMNKAMKAEEKINREAEKIVKWAKQTSARMRASNIRDELSDDDDTTK